MIKIYTRSDEIGMSHRNKPIIFLGLGLFLAIAITGWVVDFVSGSGGPVAMICSAAAFVVLTVFLVIEQAVRKRAARPPEPDDLYDYADYKPANQYDIPAEERFLRHVEPAAEVDEAFWNTSEFIKPGVEEVRFATPGYEGDGYSDDLAEGDGAAAGSRRAVYPYEDNEDDKPEFPEKGRGAFSGIFKRRGQKEEDISNVIAGGQPKADFFSEKLPQQTQAQPDHNISFAPVAPPAAAAPFEAALEAPDDAGAQYAAQPFPEDSAAVQNEGGAPAAEAEDFLKPVLVLTGTAQQADQAQPDDTSAAEISPPGSPVSDEAIDEPAFVPDLPAPEAAVAAASALSAAPSVTVPMASPPTVQTEPGKIAPMVAPGVAVTPNIGQSLESFWESMSEEDIMYRDCVEVWAADAKSPMLRLMKYVESIEDKKTQSLFGRECEYINAMMDRVFTFTQLEYLDELMDPKRYNFASLVKECLRRFSPFFMEKRLGLLWKGLETEAMIDKRWFIFALTQVVFNAVEFTDVGGKIAISAARNGDFVELAVQDSGRGIPKNELPYIFAAGYMGDGAPNPEGRRTGMGLFIARSVIKKMGGEMYAESEVGKGTKVTMRIPTRL